MEESADITSTILSIKEGNNKNNNNGKVKEQQYITSMLSNISANDLKSFKKYLEENNSKIKNDLSNIKYNYSVDPNIYTIE